MTKLKNIHKFQGNLTLKTGLHIGGNKNSIHIGGVDSPVIKVNTNGKELPYIPGSSLKGKLRCLLELNEGLTDVCSDGNHIISKIFGCGKSDKITFPGALIVRDAFLCDEEKNKNKKDLFEVKSENSINRRSGTANSPRFIERVNPEINFDMELVIKEYEGVDYQEVKDYIVKGLEMLQLDYLGGSGTRGYGKIDISEIIENLKNDIEVKEE